jgi:hypothetical protein
LHNKPWQKLIGVVYYVILGVYKWVIGDTI